MSMIIFKDFYIKRWEDTWTRYTLFLDILRLTFIGFMLLPTENTISTIFFRASHSDIS